MVSKIQSSTQARMQTRLTAQDYFDLPESDEQYELIDGELYIVAPPIPEHQDFLAEIFTVIRVFVRENRLGKVYFSPIGVVLSDDNVFEPDMIFISSERLHIINWGRAVEGAPDLVVEVLSPSTASRDRTIKRERYAQFGVREYWIADIVARTIEVNVLNGNEFTTVGVYGEGDELVSALLPGFRLDIGDTFRNAML